MIPHPPVKFIGTSSSEDINTLVKWISDYRKEVSGVSDEGVSPVPGLRTKVEVPSFEDIYEEDDDKCFFRGYN